MVAVTFVLNNQKASPLCDIGLESSPVLVISLDYQTDIHVIFNKQVQIYSVSRFKLLQLFYLPVYILYI